MSCLCRAAAGRDVDMFWGVTADQYRDVLGDRLSPVMKHPLLTHRV